MIPKKKVWDNWKEEDGVSGVVEEQCNYGECIGT